MNIFWLKPTAVDRKSAGLIVLLTVCSVLPAASAADRPQPTLRPGAPHLQSPRQSPAPVKRIEPRLAEFKRELASYKKNVSALQREVQRLQVQQRRLHTLARQLSSVGDDGQTLQFQLQQAMQKQQQIIQTLSNIMKKTSETQDSLVHNIK